MSVRKRTWITRKGERGEAWIVDYTNQARTRCLKTFNRKKDADAYAATVHVDIRAGVHTSSKATVAEAGQHWIESCRANDLEASRILSTAPKRPHLALSRGCEALTTNGPGRP